MLRTGSRGVFCHSSCDKIATSINGGLQSFKRNPIGFSFCACSRPVLMAVLGFKAEGKVRRKNAAVPSSADL